MTKRTKKHKRTKKQPIRIAAPSRTNLPPDAGKATKPASFNEILNYANDQGVAKGEHFYVLAGAECCLPLPDIEHQEGVTVMHSLAELKMAPVNQKKTLVLLNFCPADLQDLLSAQATNALVKDRNTELLFIHRGTLPDYHALLAFHKHCIVEDDTAVLRNVSSQEHIIISRMCAERALRHPEYLDYETRLRQVLNNAFFSNQYLSFGLHFNYVSGGKIVSLVMFDHNLAYNPQSRQIYILAGSEIHPLAKLDNDPNAALTQQLKYSEFARCSDSYHYVTFKNKIYAATVRQACESISKQFQEQMRGWALNLLKELEKKECEENLQQAIKCISAKPLLRNATKRDVAAFALLETDKEQFAQYAKSKPEALLARDLAGTSLAYSICQDEHCELFSLLQKQLSKGQGHIAQTERDYSGLTLLDMALDNKAYKLAKLLIKLGFDPEEENIFGMSTLKRARTLGDGTAVALLANQ